MADEKRTEITRLEPLIDEFVGQSEPYYRRVFATMLQAPATGSR